MFLKVCNEKNEISQSEFNGQLFDTFLNNFKTLEIFVIQHYY